MKKKIEPRRIFEELAEMGVLGDLLNSHWREFYENNEKFREDVNEILLNLSDERVIVLEKYFLDKLCESLQFFLDYNKQWISRRQ